MHSEGTIKLPNCNEVRYARQDRGSCGEVEYKFYPSKGQLAYSIIQTPIKEPNLDSLERVIGEDICLYAENMVKDEQYRYSLNGYLYKAYSINDIDIIRNSKDYVSILLVYEPNKDYYYVTPDREKAVGIICISHDRLRAQLGKKRLSKLDKAKAQMELLDKVYYLNEYHKGRAYELELSIYRHQSSVPWVGLDVGELNGYQFLGDKGVLKKLAEDVCPTMNIMLSKQV